MKNLIIKKNIFKYYLLKLFLIIIFFLYLFIFKRKKKLKKNILIEIEIVNIKGRGPVSFNKGLGEILPYNTSYCSFIASQDIYPFNAKNKVDYFYISYPLFNESIYNEWIKINKANKLILGPNFVPANWYRFPNKHYWKERRFNEILNTVKGIAVHTDRVKNHLALKTHTEDKIKKYKIIRPCTNLKPKDIKKFKYRTIDILLFEKYADLNRKQQGKQLLNLFKKSGKKIEQLKYGNYTKEKMQQMANNTKFLIYFSFFDAGPIGLIEIQNYGVILFTHQKEFVHDNNTSFYIPELKENNIKNAYKVINKKIEMIIKKMPDSQIIAKKNQENNKCEKSLEDLCQGII